MAMDLDTMRTFVTVAATGNLTTAARELGITPAAVSKHLAKTRRFVDLFADELG